MRERKSLALSQLTSYNRIPNSPLIKDLFNPRAGRLEAQDGMVDLAFIFASCPESAKRTVNWHNYASIIFADRGDFMQARFL